MANTKSKQPTSRSHATNEQLAAALREAADLLESQGASPFRVRAYRNAARTIDELKEPLWPLVDEQDSAGLRQLPTIGRSIAGSLSHMIRTGKFPLLERLRGDDTAERLFATVADIGPKLAQRIHEHLDIETLTELEAAARDGRLAQVPGMGEKRLRAVRESLAGRFRHAMPAETKVNATTSMDAPIEELLDVDRRYRDAEKKGRLPRIAPRRFNPTRAAWLPILHTECESRHYTAMYSNSARAHETGATHDWVVIYRDDDGNHGQWTVITSTFGTLRGKRIVRGRETECESYYAEQAASAATQPARGLAQQMLL